MRPALLPERVNHVFILLDHEHHTRPADHVLAHVDLVVKHAFLHFEDLVNFQFVHVL